MREKKERGELRVVGALLIPVCADWAKRGPWQERYTCRGAIKSEKEKAIEEGRENLR